MSYRIDGVMTYWGGKSLSDPLAPPSEGVMEAMGRLLAKELTKYELEMKEKKTKKMTKAEAFEWLKCKKIDACDQVEAVQKKLFSLGVVWISGDKSIYDFGRYYFVDEKGELSHCDGFEDFWIHHSFEKITYEDILSLEIEEECAKDGNGEYAANKISLLGSQICEILRQMNGHYHVAITEDSVNLYPEGTNLYYIEPF